MADNYKTNNTIGEDNYVFEDDYYNQFKFIMSILVFFLLCFFGFLAYNIVMEYWPKKKKILLQEDSLIPAQIINEPKKQEIMIEL
jgi:hypothetical protein